MIKNKDDEMKQLILKNEKEKEKSGETKTELENKINEQENTLKQLKATHEIEIQKQIDKLNSKNENKLQKQKIELENKIKKLILKHEKEKEKLNETKTELETKINQHESILKQLKTTHEIEMKKQISKLNS
eukprot:19201_1